jgi:hypothetical protein
MTEATQLAKLHGAAAVDDALSRAAMHGRFGDGDLASILAHLASAAGDGSLSRAGEAHSLQPGTASWEGFGR